MTVLPPLPHHKQQMMESRLDDSTKEVPAPLTPAKYAAGRSRGTAEVQTSVAGRSNAGRRSEARVPSGDVPLANESGVSPLPEPGRIEFPSSQAETSTLVPRLPSLRSRRISPLVVSFLLCFLLPLLAYAIYLIWFASEQYVAEFRFSVTETNSSGLSTVVPSSQSAASAMVSSPATALLGGTAIASASPQNFVVVDYLKSREALDELQKRINIREMYARPGIDWWQRLDKGASIEKFSDYWSSIASASYDPVTGLAVAKIKAFTAADAFDIAQTLVKLSEELVNSIAQRAQTDAVRFAEKEVTRAQDRLKDIRVKLLEFRSKEGIIDPTSGVVATNVELAKQLRANLIQAQTDLSTLRARKLELNAPAAQLLQSRIAAIKDQLARVEREVAQDRDGARALAELMARFEMLDLDRQYAQSMLISALQIYDQARASAAAQHLYLTPYVRPSLPQSATYPRRLLSLALAAIALLGLWLCAVTIYRSIRDHAL